MTRAALQACPGSWTAGMSSVLGAHRDERSDDAREIRARAMRVAVDRRLLDVPRERAALRHSPLEAHAELRRELRIARNVRHQIGVDAPLARRELDERNEAAIDEADARNRHAARSNQAHAIEDER